MDLKTKFNLIVSEMSLRAISEIFDIGKKGAVKLKKGESVRVDSDKLISFLNKKQF
ncbi:hypothetical protein [Tissierella praeacuta]|uniref:hypothetical protein n=1 Tax=Tissierella praeacuta TaxID=43131 RepID=UPI0033418928